MRGMFSTSRYLLYAMFFCGVSAIAVAGQSQGQPAAPVQAPAQSNCGTVAECVAACEKDDIGACYRANEHYLLGTGGAERDDAKAAAYSEKACNGGDVRGCVNLGFLYENGRGVARDLARALALYQKACDGGSLLGCANYGYFLSEGKGTARNEAKAVEIFTSGCKQNDGGNCYRLGFAKETGQGTAKDTAEAAALYEKACDLNYAGGCNALGWLFRWGIGMERAEGRAAPLFKRACDAGHAAGCNNLGEMYNDGRGVAQNRERAAGLFQRSCDGGNAIGCVNVGYAYFDGLGVAKSEERAAPFFERACNAGEMRGCNTLGFMHQTGRGIKKDEARGATFYTRACEGGNQLACANLGMVHRDGSGVPVDLQKAYGFFTQSCNAKNAIGCNSLGNLVEYGRGIAADGPRALQLYAQACDGGNQLGCANLGRMHFEGRLVAKNEKRGVEILSGACEKGNAYACNFMGVALEYARGVERMDEAQALAFYKKACDGGDAPGCTNFKRLGQENPELAKAPASVATGSEVSGKADAGAGASGRAEPAGPRIDILEPSDASRGAVDALGAKAISVRGRASDARGVHSVLINQKPANTRVVDSDTVEFWLEEVLLRPGRNEITVVAINTEREASQARFTVTRPEADVVAGSGTKIRDRWALIVGISNYGPAAKNVGNLQFARRDAEEFYKFLRSPEGGAFPPDRILLLTDAQATSTRLRGGVRDFLGKAGEDDLVVLFFAGHGLPDPARPNVLYLLTYDSDPARLGSTAFDMDELKLALAKSVTARRVVAFVDSCHSGGAGGLFTSRAGASRFETLNRYLAELARTRPGAVMFSASQTNESSFEDKRWGGGHGVFTYYLLEGMRGKADRNGDGVVVLQELMDYVSEMVKKDTNYQQHPTITTSSVFDPNLPMGVKAKAGEKK